MCGYVDVLIYGCADMWIFGHVDVGRFGCRYHMVVCGIVDVGFMFVVRHYFFRL